MADSFETSMLTGPLFSLSVSIYILDEVYTTALPYIKILGQSGLYFYFL